MNRQFIPALFALLIGCGGSQFRVAGHEVALPLGDESPRVGKTVRRVGVMWSLIGDTTELVDVPAVTRVNEATTVRVEVSGGGCSGPDTTTAYVDGLVATIVPYQRVYTPIPPNGYCTDVLQLGSREIQVRFPTRGTARVRIVYRQGDAGALTITERSILVQ